MQEKIVNGERIVTVETEEEFWQVYEEGQGKFLIEAPDGMAERLGFTDPEPRDA